jgi:hypothetical protein
MTGFIIACAGVALVPYLLLEVLPGWLSSRRDKREASESYERMAREILKDKP